MPHSNYPNNITFDFIKKRCGDMITSRKGSSGNSGILLPDSGKSSILRKTVRGQPGLSLTSKNSIELQFIAKHDKTPRPWLSPALTCSAKLWYYSMIIWNWSNRSQITLQSLYTRMFIKAKTPAKSRWKCALSSTTITALAENS